MELDVILSKLHGVRKSGDSWKALCPSHADHEPSLSITRKDGRVLLHCHAGCETEAVVQALGLKVSDLFDKPNEQQEARPVKGRIVKTYDYTDASGNLLFQVVRYEPKGFRQRRPDGNGGYLWNLQGVQRVLYRLPEVVKAVEQGETVFVVEGEKDADSLHAIGLTATTNAGGAGKWEESYSRALEGASVCILPDNDDPGRKHGQDVARSLYGKAESIKMLELPNLPPKGDVSDWLASGGTREKLLQLVEQAEEWQPTEDEQGETQAFPGSAPDGFPLTDMGNSERLVHYFGKDLRYVSDWKRWIIWDGIHWSVDRSLEIERLAKETVRRIYSEAETAQDSDERKAIARWAMKSESVDRIAAMIRLAQSGVTITADKLDLDPYLLACENGVLDLRTGELLSPCRENYITKQVPIDFDPQAECPAWENFLTQVLSGPDVRSYMQKAVGYTLTADVSEQCLFFLFGEGKNGKTTFVEAVSELLGDYFAKIPSEAVMLKQNTESKREAVALVGKRLIATSEVSKGQKLNEGFIKDMTGGDTLAAKPLYGEQFNFKAGFKLWMYGNHKPTIRGKDEGIWRRLRLIPFTTTIPPAYRDKHLPDKLRRELPGILCWAVEGCLLWQAEGLDEPVTILDAVNEYRHEQDGLADFLADCCTFDRKAIVTKKELWTAYREWVDATGEEGYESQRMFNDEIRGRPGIKEGRGTGNVAIWKGITLSGCPDASENDDNLSSKVTEVTEVTDFPVKSLREEIQKKVTEFSVTSVTKVTPERGTDPNTTVEKPDRPIIQGVSQPGKCFSCGTRSNGKVEGQYICLTCYERRYPP